MNSEHCMDLAFQEALKAFDEGEVPVGAVVESGGTILGRGYNRMESLGDITAHAEIIALSAASSTMNARYLENTILYVTLEPCLMCLGAILQSRIRKIVYGTPDPRLGALDSAHYRQEIERTYRYFPLVESGVMQARCRGLLDSFFKKIRRND